MNLRGASISLISKRFWNNFSNNSFLKIVRQTDNFYLVEHFFFLVEYFLFLLLFFTKYLVSHFLLILFSHSVQILVLSSLLNILSFFFSFPPSAPLPLSYCLLACSRSSFCLFLSSPLIFLHIVIFSSLDFESIDSLWGGISSCWPDG